MKLLAALIALSASLPGCLTISAIGIDRAPIAAHKAEQQTGKVWPARWGDEMTATKGVIVPIAGPRKAWSPARLGPWHSRLPKGNETDIVRALAAGRAKQEGYRYRMEGYGAFIFERDLDIPEPDEHSPKGRSEPASMFVFASGRVAQSPNATDASPRVNIERTWFAFYNHRRDGSPEPSDPGIGTIMLLPGLFGIPEPVVDVVTSTMRQRGWNVIRMLAPPARFVETTDITLDPDDPQSPIDAADEVMTRIAESAYAAHAAWDYILDANPSLAPLPKMAFGGSAGGLALPAVIKRDHARYDGAVIVGGGANILDVVSRSTYTKPVQALDFKWAGDNPDKVPAPAQLDPFTKSYLQHAPLDGAHAGNWFGDLPVLIMQASGDKAVPVEASERLWSALGEPEKWEIQGSHMTLFLSLWLHTPRILDWAQANVIEQNDPSTAP